MRSLFLGIAALVSLSAIPADAATLSAGSLIGRWCGDGVNYNVSRNALTVTRKGEKKPLTIKITSFRIEGNEVQIFFAEPYGGGSRFSEFSPDGKTMAQQGSTFGTMPRRVFKRC